MKASGLSQMTRGFDSLRGRSAQRCGLGLLRAGALLVLLGLMAGCVTKYSGGNQMSSDPEGTLDERVVLARQYIGVGGWENAKRNLELVQEVDPNNAEVFEAFALLYQSIGEFEMAENRFRAALKAEPALSRARNNCATFLYSQGRFIEAEREFYRVTEDTLYSDRPVAFVNLGLCRLQLEYTAGAEAAFTRAMSMDRRDPEALLEMGFLHLEAGDTHEAARYHGTFRTVSPQQSPRGLLLGLEIADQTGDWDPLGSYELALRNLYPDSLEYRAWTERQSR
jgi:type IV pilus assembly protein PilF